MDLSINDTFNKELPADKNITNTRRQVMDACFSYVTPTVPSNPEIVHVSDEVLELIGLNQNDKTSSEFLATFSGSKVINGTSPYAMCYGGHQFGNWAGQLGDGRAINLTEVSHKGKQWALQLKGSGATPYSRTADGLAVLRSSIREHLCSEAMYHLGVTTTRSLSLMLSGDDVLRDMMYDGNAAYEKGAIVCRVAPSFIRFGNFQILAARKNIETLQRLVDYTIRHFYHSIDPNDDKRYALFFHEVLEATLDMVIQWQRVGFVHGVMNTDNLSILGLTIDYGPYGWLEGYDPNWTPNTTDRQHKRYRYGNQPNIAFWNLAQLGNALVPLMDDHTPLQAALDKYASLYQERNLSMYRQKLGLIQSLPKDQVLISQLLQVLQLSETDMTIFFRRLSEIAATMSEDTSVNLSFISEAFYKPEEIQGEILNEWTTWLESYVARIQKETNHKEDRKKVMDLVNPKYVLRNYMAQLAIDKANMGDYSLVDEMYTLLKKPYDEQPSHQKWFAKRPEWARSKVGCSMLSCSS